jgi:hypothetical protein
MGVSMFTHTYLLSYQVRIYKRILIIPDLKEPTINLENKE